MTTRAIVRRPAPNLGDGITTASLGAPDVPLALAQHAAYCGALARAGVAVTALDADPHHPDAHFVEDAAIALGMRAVLARPGAAARRDEPDALREPLRQWFSTLDQIVAPGTLDGGDVCDAGERCFIGISPRTNRAGAAQFARIVEATGRDPIVVDVRPVAGVLHLKSAMASLGDGTIVVTDECLSVLPAPLGRIVRVGDNETYAANCVRVNDVVFVAAGYPRIRRDLERAGYPTVALDVSEFRKMDGGLSCLSIRF